MQLMHRVDAAFHFDYALEEVNLQLLESESMSRSLLNKIISMVWFVGNDLNLMLFDVVN